MIELCIMIYKETVFFFILKKIYSDGHAVCHQCSERVGPVCDNSGRDKSGRGSRVWGVLQTYGKRPHCQVSACQGSSTNNNLPDGALSPHHRLTGSSCLEVTSSLPPAEPIIEQRFRHVNLRFERAVWICDCKNESTQTKNAAVHKRVAKTKSRKTKTLHPVFTTEVLQASRGRAKWNSLIFCPTERERAHMRSLE